SYWIQDWFTKIRALPELGESEVQRIIGLGVDPTNGALYAFPHFEQTAGDQINVQAVVNKEWLAAVGEEAPTTVEDLYRVLKKFAEQDPNGNGKKDELPLVGSDTLYSADIVEFIINAYIYCCDQNIYNVTDGKVWVPYTEDEYREALIFVNKLYKEGLLTPLFFSMNNNGELAELNTPTDQVAIAGITAGSTSIFYTSDNPVLYQYQALAPLKAATSRGGWAPFRGNTYQYVVSITRDAADPQICFRLLDFMCSFDSYVRMRYGKYGEDWTDPDPGTTGSLGYPSAWKTLKEVYSVQSGENWHQLRGIIKLQKYHSGTFNDNGSWSAERTKLNRNIFQLYSEGNHPAEVITKLTYSASQAEVRSELEDQLKSYFAEARALFIAGTMDPNSDADWNTYLSNLKNMGLERLIEAVQGAYDFMVGK
ncbi:MAG: hypothetical protein J5794_00085, partial [Lachnospiraceae bacterium]|nr:hypothetical protein [Lachnospiraceae bacterium]